MALCKSMRDEKKNHLAVMETLIAQGIGTLFEAV